MAPADASPDDHPRAPRWVAACLRLQLAAAVVYALGVAGALGAVGIDWRPDSWADFLPVLLLGLPVVVARPLLFDRDRAAWALMAAGWSFYCAGWVVWEVAYADLASPPYPSIADALWLVLYPCAWASIVLLLRDRLPRLTRPMWLDGAVCALGASALAVAFALPAVSRQFGGGTAQNATLLSYPLSDALVLSLLAGGLAVCGRHGAGLLWGLAAGFLALLVADVGWMLLLADESYVTGGWLDLGWPVLALVVARSAWAAPSALAPRAGAHRTTAALPTLFGGAAAVLLVCAAFVSVEPVAVVAAVAAVIAFGIRGVLAMREAHDLRDVRTQSLTDDLTGLPNRRRLQAAMEERPTTHADAGMAIALLDLDGFKEINETLGHRAGDALLVAVGQRLAGALGDAVVARVGGDEFAVLAPCGAGEAQDLIGGIREALGEPLPVDGLTVHLRGTVGVAFTEPSQGFEEVFRRAEVAMYRGKATHAEWSIYEPDADQQSRQQLRLVSDLRRALDGDHDEIVPFYQPQIDVATGTMRGAEALARWEHPQQGRIGPDVFVPLAESHGLMKQLTLHMVDRALADCARWHALGHAFAVSVNVSAVNLVDAQLPTDVAAALTRHGVAPQALTLEVTEADVMSDYERAEETLAQLRALGVSLSLDDFGTGHSSLARLRTLPVDEIKIDRSFVTTMMADPHDHAIVSAVLDLARRFGLRPVAEGIEDEATWNELRAMGCATAQGYLLGRPQPVDQLLEAARGGFAPPTDAVQPPAPELLTVKLATAPTVRDACSVVVQYLAARGFGLPSVYVQRGARLRCQASLGYWQVLDGLPLGTGVIGACLQQDRTLDVDLRGGDGNYLEAASGVCFELAVPIRCDGRALGVLNVEDREPFPDGTREELEAVAGLLGRRLEAMGAAGGESPGQQLGRLVERLAEAPSSADVRQRLAQAGCELTGMESAFVTTRAPGDWRRDATGPLAPAFSTLTSEELVELTEHVAHGASLVAAGDAEGEGLARLAGLRAAGATTLVLVALRHLGHSEGLLVLADRRPEPPPTERIELLELLASHATGTLQTLDTVERLRQEARRDPLTGLGHRGAFRAALEEAVAAATTGQPVAVAFIDLDHFKSVNDTEGHLAGDRLLRETAGRLTDRLRHDDGVFRIGGDEFAAVLRHTGGMDLQAAAERLREAAGANGRTTASVGVTSWRPGEPVQSLLARADAALYTAKRSGRDAVRLA